MDYVLAALVGLFIAIGTYLLLSRSVIRMLIGLTIFGLFLTPVFYVVLQKIAVRKPKPAVASVPLTIPESA